MKCLYQIADLDVHIFPMPVINSNMYVLTHSGSALIVDPWVSNEAEELLRSAQISQCTVLLTHEHYDHISGVNWLRAQYPCRVVCSETCARGIADPRKKSGVLL